MAVVTFAALVSAGGAIGAPAADAQNGYQRGPDPTEQSVTASRGTFATDTQRVSSTQVNGFGGGTVYYPESTAQGTFGGVVIAPGFTADQSSMAWLGDRLASQGFVVFTIDTITRSDQPDSRARQMDAALNYLVNQSAAKNTVDKSRLAVMGHSMGGGGTLALAEDRPDLKAAIPLTPWHTQKNFSSVRVPTLIIGAQNDTIAPVRQHAIPFYDSLNDNLDSAYLELRGASHLAPNFTNATIGKYALSWLKLFVDSDTRYTKFLCPTPGTGIGSDFSTARSTCPFGDGASPDVASQSAPVEQAPVEQAPAATTTEEAEAPAAVEPTPKAAESTTKAPAAVR